MDLSYPAEAETYRTTVNEFLDANLPDDWQGFGAMPEEERIPVSYTHLTLPTILLV